MAKTLTIRAPADLDAFIRRLDDPRDPLETIGVILTRGSQQAFDRQAFGSKPWPARYFGRGTPFVNVAGLLQDLGEAPRVKSRRFEKRPALSDTGQLRNTITWNVNGDEVEYGSPRDYAKTHQQGGESSVPITPTTIKNLAKWLRTSQGVPFQKRLGYLFQAGDSYDFKVIRRPFLGITDEGERDIRDEVEAWAAGE